MGVTRENKGKPFELSSGYEIKTLIFKDLCKLGLSSYREVYQKSVDLEQKSLTQKSWLCHFLSVCVSGQISVSEL